MAQTTFIVRKLTDDMVSRVAEMAPADAYAKLIKWALGDLRHCVTVQNGSGAFRDRVEWNQRMRDVSAGVIPLTFKVEPRRGYRLFTFSA